MILEHLKEQDLSVNINNKQVTADEADQEQSDLFDYLFGLSLQN